MRLVAVLLCAGLLHAESFDLASVRRVAEPMGPDYSNKLSSTAMTFSAHNATLARLIAEAYHVQLSQVSGPTWITRNEYEVEARASAVSPLMLRALLSDRFRLKLHSVITTRSVQELSVDQRGFHQPSGKTGYHFVGDMRQLADLIGVQLLLTVGPRRRSHSPAERRTGVAAHQPQSSN